MEIGRVLNLTVRAYSGGATSVIMGLSYALSDMALRGRNLGLGFAVSGAMMMATGGLIISAFKNMITAAIDYDSAMRRIATLTETLPANFAAMKDAVLEMTRTIPKSANEMADALYFIKSVVTDDSAALDILEISAKAASLAMAETEPIAKVLSSAYVAYGGTIKDVTAWSDQLTQAVSEGRAEYQDFATQMGSLIGTGNTLGVSFKELSTWMAFMTKRGYSAAQSAVLIKNVMGKIAKPTAAAVEEYKRLNLEWGPNAIKSAGGLIPYLHKMMKATDGNVESIMTLLPGLRQYPLVLNMLQDSAKGAGSDLAYLQGKIENSAGTVESRFATAMEGAQAQLQLMKNAFSEVSIRIGTIFLPMLGAVMAPIREMIVGIAAWIQKNPELAASLAKMTLAVGLFLTVAGGIMLVIGLFSMLGSVLGPVALLALGLAAVLPPLIQWLVKLKDAVAQTDTYTFLAAAWKDLTAAMKTAWTVIKTTWALFFGKTDFTALAKKIEHFAMKVSEMAGNFKRFTESEKFREWVRTAVGLVEKFRDALVTLRDNLPTVVGGIVALVTAVGGFMAIQGVITAIGAIAGFIQAIALLGPAVAGVAAGGVTMAEAVGLVGGSLGGLVPVIAFVAANFWPVVLVVGAVIAVLILLWQNWKTVFGFIKALVGNLMTIFGPVFAQVISIVKDQMVPLWDSLKLLWTNLQPVIQALAAIFLGVLAVAIGIIVGVLSGLAHALPGIIMFFTGLVNIISGVMGLVIGIVEAVVAFFIGVFTGDWSGLEAAGKKIWDSIKAIVTGIVQVIGGFITTVLGFFIGFYNGVVGWFKALYDTLVGHSIVPDMIKAIVQWFAGLPGKVMAFVKSMVDQAVTAAKNMATNFGKAILDMVNNAVSYATGMAGRIKSAVGGLGGVLTDAGKAVLNSLKAGMQAIWDSTVSKWLSGLAAKIKALKGPIAKDKTMLTSEGSAIIGGLGVGMQQAWAGVQSQLGNYNKELAGAFSGAGVGGMNPSYTMSAKQEIVHRVEFGTLPDGLKIDMTGQEIARLITGDKTALTEVSRQITVTQKKEIR